MNKVFIVCEPSHRISGERVGSVDLTPAADWGEPIILLQSSQTLLDPSPTITTLHEKLCSFSDDDYFVPIGDPILMCAAAAVAAMYNEGRVKMLKWDRFLKKYIPIQINIKD